MKPKTILTLLLFAVTILAQAQNENEYIPYPKADLQDVVDALSLADINIFKHDLGVIDKNCKISVIVEEWKDFKLVDSNTQISLPVKTTFSPDYVREAEESTTIRAINKKFNDSLMIVEISINDRFRPIFLNMKQLDKENRHLPYFPVPYKHKLVETDKNVPIMLYGTMWYDEDFDVYRFCGRQWLTDEKGDEASKELLTSSPHFYIVYYRIEDNL